MGTYYRHKKTESIDVPYSFKCEQCMQDSGPLKATIKGMEAEVNSNSRTLNKNNQDKLDNKAHANLVSAVRAAHYNATEKQIFDKAFKDECPHCHKPQSWAVSGLKDDMFGTPVVCFFVGLIIAVGCYFYDHSYLNIALVIGGIGLAAAIVTLVWNIMKINSKKKQTANVTQRNVPVIEWSAVQNLLDK